MYEFLAEIYRIYKSGVHQSSSCIRGQNSHSLVNCACVVALLSTRTYKAIHHGAKKDRHNMSDTLRFEERVARTLNELNEV